MDAAAAASAAPAPAMSSRASNPEKPADPRVEARNARYEEFKAAGYERRIELFERTLNEPLLMDGEMAFSMLSEIFDGAVQRDERDRHNECVERLRTTLPDVYEEEAAFLLENCVCNAIVMRRDERIHAYALELAALAETKFENWHRTESQLAYHGYLRTLITAMRLAWPEVCPSDNVLPWARQTFANRAIQYEILSFIEHIPAPPRNDPALLEQIRFFCDGDIDPERTADIVAWQAGQMERRWTESDFKLRPRKQLARSAWNNDQEEDVDESSKESADEPDAGAQNLLNLTLQFLGYAHRIEGKPYSRAELARSEIYTFIARRQAGELEYRESLLDTTLRASGRKRGPIKKFKAYDHLLCPDYERLDRYVGGLLKQFSVDFYAAAALLECVPAWIRFLQLQGLVDADGVQRTLRELQPLAANVLRAFEKMRSDPGLCEAIRQCPEWRTSGGVEARGPSATPIAGRIRPYEYEAQLDQPLPARPGRTEENGDHSVS